MAKKPVSSPPALLADVIRQRREELGMSQTSLADRIGVTQSAIAQWETDANGPSLPNLRRLALELSLELNDLIELVA